MRRPPSAPPQGLFGPRDLGVPLAVGALHAAARRAPRRGRGPDPRERRQLGFRDGRRCGAAAAAGPPLRLPDSAPLLPPRQHPQPLRPLYPAAVCGGAARQGSEGSPTTAAEAKPRPSKALPRTQNPRHRRVRAARGPGGAGAGRGKPQPKRGVVHRAQHGRAGGALRRRTARGQSEGRAGRPGPAAGQPGRRRGRRRGGPARHATARPARGAGVCDRRVPPPGVREPAR